MPTHKTRQKEQAKYLYLTTSKTQKAIADILGISEQTMCAWVKKEDWPALKMARYHSPAQELQQLYDELREINANIKARDEGLRYATKEELETKVKILSLISGHLKNTADNWRNLPPEFDIPVEAAAKQDTGEDYTTTLTKDGKAIGKVRAGDMNMRGKTKDGLYAYDIRTMHDYYMKVAALYVAADTGSKEYFKGGDDYVAPGLRHIRNAIADQEAKEARQQNNG